VLIIPVEDDVESVVAREGGTSVAAVYVIEMLV